MKIFKKILCPIAAFILLATVTACKEAPAVPGERNSDVCGKWAYIHEPEKTVAKFNEDGYATYENKDYTFTTDDTFIYLTDKKGDITKLRYEINEKGMVLCKNTEYTYQMEGTPDSIVGYWLCEKDNYEFQFSAAGTFMEDGAFTGHYIVDPEESTVRLMYGQYFEDTVCHYSVNGNVLTVEYPWQMVETTK